MKVQIPENAATCRYILTFFAFCLLLFSGEPDLLETIVSILRRIYLGV